MAPPAASTTSRTRPFSSARSVAAARCTGDAAGPGTRRSRTDDSGGTWSSHTASRPSCRRCEAAGVSSTKHAVAARESPAGSMTSPERRHDSVFTTVTVSGAGGAAPPGAPILPRAPRRPERGPATARRLRLPRGRGGGHQVCDSRSASTAKRRLYSTARPRRPIGLADAVGRAPGVLAPQDQRAPRRLDIRDRQPDVAQHGERLGLPQAPRARADQGFLACVDSAPSSQYGVMSPDITAPRRRDAARIPRTSRRPCR